MHATSLLGFDNLLSRRSSSSFVSLRHICELQLHSWVPAPAPLSFSFGFLVCLCRRVLWTSKTTARWLMWRMRLWRRCRGYFPLTNSYFGRSVPFLHLHFVLIPLLQGIYPDDPGSQSFGQGTPAAQRHFLDAGRQSVGDIFATAPKTLHIIAQVRQRCEFFSISELHMSLTIYRCQRIVCRRIGAPPYTLLGSKQGSI